MKSFLLRWPAIAMLSGLLLVPLSGCVVAGGGYSNGTASIGLDYYEPVGGAYGAWGPGYQVGPYRDGGPHPAPGGGEASHPGGPVAHPAPGGSSPPRAYRPAPASHPMPSIPTRSSGRK